MKKIQNILLPLLILICCAIPDTSKGCTSAIISADMNPYGRPLLWKHRDTSTTDNKVEYVPSSNGSYSYVALFDAKDKDLTQAWTGMNEVGFAIMNTASFNIKRDKVPNKKMDREGFVMTRALQTCKSIDDFALLLETLPRPMGVEANFGVIDASGNGAFFETNNNSYKRYDLKDAENGVLIRTNYSYSGTKGKGYGYTREADAAAMLSPYLEKKAVTPEVLTEVLSRSFYDSKKCANYCTVDISDPADIRIISTDSTQFVMDKVDEVIPRYKSTATIVIEGCRPIQDLATIEPGSLADEYIMWTGLGYPPCSEIVPVWCRPDGVPAELTGSGENGHSVMGDKVKARRDDVFSSKKGSKNNYMDMTKLFNSDGSGYLQVLIPQNLETYRQARMRRNGKR